MNIKGIKLRMRELEIKCLSVGGTEEEQKEFLRLEKRLPKKERS